MSPSPDRFPQPPKSPLADEQHLHPDEQPSDSSERTPSESVKSAAAKPLDAVAKNGAESASVSATSSESSASESESKPLVPKRPLMRPVSRPQPPSPPPAATKAPATPPPPQPEVATVPSAVATGASDDLAAAQAAIRQQPIPPPSEPKQYRAIGLVRGRYAPSEEQFTRGAMVTADGAEIEAVLLGRVMSLVRNHLDLEQEHLWVVYPRTRETRDDLHVQIVGVWEPEKLNKPEDGTEDGDALEATASEADMQASPGFADNYFSIRGEVVFYSGDDQQIVIKIQQAPRKSTDKEKAFKLKLDGTLASPKTLGYFWELDVERRGAVLVVTGGNVIGLVPPKKKSASSGFKRGGDRRPPQRRARPAGVKSAGPVGAPRREPLPKPVKRTEQASDS